jgi:hypothetical protein
MISLCNMVLLHRKLLDYQRVAVINPLTHHQVAVFAGEIIPVKSQYQTNPLNHIKTYKIIK